MQSDLYPQQQFTEDQADASPRIILELKNVQNDVCEIGDHVQRMEDQMTSMLQMMEHMTRLMISKNKHKTKKTPASKPEFRNGSTEKDVSEYLNLAEALQENILMFLEDLSFQESLMLDQLLAKDCLTEDECENIRSFGNRCDGIRTLIRIIKRRDSKTIREFLNIIGEDSPHLKNKVHETFNDKQNKESKDKQQMCPTCLMIKIVDLKDIADILWREKLLSDELYDIVIVDAERLSEILWNTILHSINKRSNSEQNIVILVKALESKYGHIASLLKGLQDKEQNLTQLQCGCYRSNRKRRRLPYAASSTQGSLASTSVANIPNLFLLNQGSLEESTEDTEPKLEKLKESFDFSDPSKYDEIESEGQAIPKVVPDEDVLNQNLDVHIEETSTRQRYKSGDFNPVNERVNVYPVNEDPKLFNRTFSTVVVCEADSTTNDDELSTVHPISQHDNYDRPKESTKSKSTKVDIKDILNRIDREGSSKESVSINVNDDQYDYEDEWLDNLSSSRSARQKSLRQQFYQRQKSAPAGITLTKSKAISNFEASVGTRERQSRKSKCSIKRTERRIRNTDTTKKSYVVAEESAHGGIPYNPMWSKIPQSRNTCKWGYPEARRHNLIENKKAEFKRRENQSKSDTETTVGESETPDLSEYTV